MITVTIGLLCASRCAHPGKRDGEACCVILILSHAAEAATVAFGAPQRAAAIASPRVAYRELAFASWLLIGLLHGTQPVSHRMRRWVGGLLEACLLLWLAPLLLRPSGHPCFLMLPASTAASAEPAAALDATRVVNAAVGADFAMDDDAELTNGTVVLGGGCAASAEMTAVADPEWVILVLGCAASFALGTAGVQAFVHKLLKPLWSRWRAQQLAVQRAQAEADRLAAEKDRLFFDWQLAQAEVSRLRLRSGGEDPPPHGMQGVHGFVGPEGALRREDRRADTAWREDGWSDAPAGVPSSPCWSEGTAPGCPTRRRVLACSRPEGAFAEHGNSCGVAGCAHSASGSTAEPRPRNRSDFATTPPTSAAASSSAPYPPHAVAAIIDAALRTPPPTPHRASTPRHAFPPVEAGQHPRADEVTGRRRPPLAKSVAGEPWYISQPGQHLAEAAVDLLAAPDPCEPADGPSESCEGFAIELLESRAFMAWISATLLGLYAFFIMWMNYCGFHAPIVTCLLCLGAFVVRLRTGRMQYLMGDTLLIMPATRIAISLYSDPATIAAEQSLVYELVTLRFLCCLCTGMLYGMLRLPAMQKALVLLGSCSLWTCAAAVIGFRTSIFSFLGGLPQGIATLAVATIFSHAYHHQLLSHASWRAKVLARLEVARRADLQAMRGFGKGVQTDVMGVGATAKAAATLVSGATSVNGAEAVSGAAATVASAGRRDPSATAGASDHADEDSDHAFTDASSDEANGHAFTEASSDEADGHHSFIDASSGDDGVADLHASSRRSAFQDAGWEGRSVTNTYSETSTFRAEDDWSNLPLNSASSTSNMLRSWGVAGILDYIREAEVYEPSL